MREAPPCTSADRLDTVRASNMIAQHFCQPNVLLEARLERLRRHYTGRHVLMWCYPLQEMPEVLG